MARPILMPQVGQDLTEGKIVAINVKLGDTVKKGDIVAEVESEKATFEVEAFESGTVIELSFNVGDIATVLKPLMMLGGEGEAVVAPTAAVLAPATIAPPLQTQTKAHSVTRAGSSPLARRLASEAGVDVTQLQGTGPDGAVVAKDVKSAHTPSAHMPTSDTGIKSLQRGTGDPVIFIHGFGADLSAWRPFVLQLGLSNPVYALDLPAHGAHANMVANNLLDLTATVLAIIRKAGLSRLHLVGHSVGAAVAAKLAHDDIGVRSLSLIAPAGLGQKINGDYIEGFLAAKSEAALKTCLDMLVHNTSVLTGALVRATFASRNGTAMVDNQKKLAMGLFEGNTQLFSIHNILAKLSAPTRVIVGHEDRIIPACYVETVPAHVAVNRLPQVGHLPQLEAATLTARLVAETVRSAG
jgi:pimeloyl-ACP methyl ester carboxylesterase